MVSIKGLMIDSCLPQVKLEKLFQLVIGAIYLSGKKGIFNWKSLEKMAALVMKAKLTTLLQLKV